MEAVPQSTFSGVSVLTHSSACSFLSDCSGTALTPPVSCFFPAASFVVFQELSCCPHVSPPPPLGRCIFYRSNRLLWCCPFDLMRETPTTVMCMCFFIPHYSAGDLDIHISPRSCFFCGSYPYCPCSLSLTSFSLQPYTCNISRRSPESPHTSPALPVAAVLQGKKPFTHSEGSNDLSVTSQMLTKFLIILCLSTAGVQRGVSDFRHKSLAFSQAGWTPGSLLKHH